MNATSNAIEVNVPTPSVPYHRARHSFSKLREFETCPHRAILTASDGDHHTPATRLGTEVHQFAEWYHGRCKELGVPTDMATGIGEIVRRSVALPVEMQRAYSSCCHHLLTWDAVGPRSFAELPGYWNRQFGWVTDPKGAYFSARVDRVGLGENGDLIVGDIKTDRKPGPEDPLRNSAIFQGTVYAALLRLCGPREYRCRGETTVVVFYARFGHEIRFRAGQADLRAALEWCKAVSRCRDAALRLWDDGRGELPLPVVNQYCGSCSTLLRCPASPTKGLSSPISDQSAPKAAAAWLLLRDQATSYRLTLEAWCGVNGPIKMADGRSVGYAEKARRLYTGADVRAALAAAGLAACGAVIDDGEYTGADARAMVGANTRSRSRARKKAMTALAELGTEETAIRFGVIDPEN